MFFHHYNLVLNTLIMLPPSIPAVVLPSIHISDQGLLLLGQLLAILSPVVYVVEREIREIEIFIIFERNKNIGDCCGLSCGSRSIKRDSQIKLINLKEMMVEEVIIATPSLPTTRISVLNR